MFHLVNNLTNKSGDALVGYYVKLKDSEGAYATLYSDANSTPIATVSGEADAGITDAVGMYDIWVVDGVYDVEFFDKNDITQLVSRIPAVPMYGLQSSADLAAAVTAAEAAQAAAEASVDAVQTDLASTDTGKGAEMIGFLQAGTGAESRDAEDKLREVISVRDYGAVGDTVRDGTGAITSGTDDTAAFQAALDVAASFGTAYTSIFVPPGVYRITGTINLDKNYIRLFGAGAKSCLCFDPSADDVMLLVQNSTPANAIGQIEIDHLGIVANYPNAYAKTALKIVDGTGVNIHDIHFTDDSWQGGSGRGSIGFHFCGRDTHKVYANIVKADQPFQAGVNPNSTTYQFDCHNIDGNYLEILKTTNYALFFEPGVNWSNTTWGANNNSYRGAGMIYLNNEGETVETSSMVTIRGVRCESGTNSGGAAGGYGIFMDFGTGNQCSNMVIENFGVADPVCNGVYLNGVISLVAKNVNIASATTAWVLENVNQCEVFSLGISDNGATVTFTDMEARILHKLAGGAPSDKSIGYALYVRNSTGAATGNLYYENGVRRWVKKQTLANGTDLTLPVPASGEIMMVRVVSGQGIGIYTVTAASGSTFPGSDSGYGVDGEAKAVELRGAAGGAPKIYNASAGNSFPFVVECVIG